MKRGTFKKKQGKPMKRSKLRKQGKQSISLIQRKLWELCKQLTRQKYGNTCYTCGTKGLESSNWQTGHLLPKASLGACLKYDLRVLRPQCYRCNINFGGRGAEFYARMVELEGIEYVNQIFRDRRLTVKALDHYLKLTEEYKELLTQKI